MADDRTVSCGACGVELDEAPGLLPEERAPCPHCRSKSRRFNVMLAASVTGVGTVTAQLTRVPPPHEATPQTDQMAETGYRVTWYQYPDGQYLVQVHNGAGELIDGGGGDDPEEMILEVAERLLPPQQ